MADASLTPTFGIWLISVFLESILYGMGVLQVFLYFRWYHNDVWAIKFSVILLLLVETLQIAIFYFGTYSHIIGGFGDPIKLLAIEWADYTQLLLLYLSAVIVQFYFCYCIYKFIHLAKTSRFIVWLLPGTIALLILLELGAGIAQVIQTSQVTSFIQLSGVKEMTSLQSAAAFIVDAMITISLVVVLRGKKSEIKQTNNMLDKLILYAINRGFLTAACALINLVLFLAMPGTFYFFLGLVSSSKLYVVPTL
ncbi:hypothetical protein L218DRAFT_1081903 [Marasmius fiardii PR-910]|nr:hypothetical protein L218DRAFT_1081903 [Marasmius fiardii PR-910]